MENELFAKGPEGFGGGGAGEASTKTLALMLRTAIFAERDEPETFKILITPALAALMLQYNTKNRNISPLIVQRYSKDMKDGRWKFNADPIRFSREGFLLDGQHRLAALIEADVSLEFYVVFGLEHDVFDTIDIGKTRSMQDTLHVAGYHKYTRHERDLASATRLLLEYYQLVDGKTPVRENSPQVIEETIRDNWGLIEATNFVRAKDVTRTTPPSPAIIVLYLASKDNKEKAEEFFRKIVKPDGLAANDAPFKFREAMIKNKLSKKKLGSYDILAMLIRAWNAYVDGRQLTSLYGVTNRSGKEHFPAVSKGNYKNERRRKGADNS